MIKIDLEKAFDRLEWSFIHYSQKFFNFHYNTIKLIMDCITTTSVSILINGKPTDYFEPSRGIRQGDPLSPYLFIICMEVLCLDITRAVEESNWKPISLSRAGPKLSHLLFADDLILFGKATRDTANSINEVLSNFSNRSGQKISFTKSKIVFSKNTSPDLCNEISIILNIATSSNIGKYLGFQITNYHPKNSDYLTILE